MIIGKHNYSINFIKYELELSKLEDKDTLKNMMNLLLEFDYTSNNKSIPFNIKLSFNTLIQLEIIKINDIFTIESKIINDTKL